ncbi:MAG: universal stress protein [Phycisphaerales bacterium]
MDRLRNILVATDLSDGGTAALVEAARLARLGPSDLHVLHVANDETGAELRQFLGAGAPATDDILRARSEEFLREQLAELGIAPKSVTVILGTPIQKIVEAVGDVSADLLVVGAIGSSGRSTIGTTAVRCVRKVPTKVLIVPPSGGGAFERTVACVDFSALSPVVVLQAARVGHLDGSRVFAIHCYQLPWERARWGPPPKDAAYVGGQFREVLQRRFETELLPHAHGHPIEFHPTVNADFSTGIVGFARDHDADLVVLGTTGRTALAYMLLGTTAEKVMRSIGCAVLAVKLPGDGVKPIGGKDEPTP